MGNIWKKTLKTKTEFCTLTQLLTLMYEQRIKIDMSPLYNKKSLKIPKGQSEAVNRRRTDNTMAKRKSTKGQTAIYKTYI